MGSCLASQQRSDCEKETTLNQTVLPNDTLRALALYPLQVGGLFKGGSQVRYPSVNVGSLVYDLNLNVSGFRGCLKNVCISSKAVFFASFRSAYFQGNSNRIASSLIGLIDAQLRVNNELLDWGPEISTVGACPMERFDDDDFLCKETEQNAICVGTRDEPNSQIYPMRFCRRGFYGTLCENSSDTVQFSGTTESSVVFMG